MRHYLIPVLIVIITLPVYAHRDRLITIDADGSLYGLPPDYSPAILDFTNFKLTIGQNEYVFPSKLTRYFALDDESEIIYYSSWYHDSNIIPYYFGIRILPKNMDFYYNILFDLDTLNLIQVEIYLNHGNGITSVNRVDLDDFGMVSDIAAPSE